MEPTMALRYPITDVRKFAASNLAFSRALVKDMCHRLSHAQHMRSFSIEDVAGRAACALVYLQDKWKELAPKDRDFAEGRASEAYLDGEVVARDGETLRG